MGEKGAMEKFKGIFDSNPDLMFRTLGGIFIFLVIFGGIIAGGIVWDMIAAAIAMASLFEFYRLLSAKFNISPWLILISGFVVLVVTIMRANSMIILLSISMIAFVALFLEVTRRQISGISNALTNIGITVSGIVYVVLPWCYMMIMRSRELGLMMLVTIFFCTWSCDVAAYLTGRRFGRTPLCPLVSPKKTWEGFIGGAAASLLCGGFLALLFYFPPLPLLLIGLLCGIAGQIGDLGESVLKREAGVKDSGSIIPGHGGLLDRFDSILVNSTLTFLIFELIG